MKRPAALRQALLSLRSPVAATRQAALDEILALATREMVDVRSAQPALVSLLARGSAPERQKALEIFEFRADMGADVGISVPALLRLQDDTDARTGSLARRALSYANKRLNGLLTAELQTPPHAETALSSDDEPTQGEAPLPSEDQLVVEAIELYYEQRQGEKAEAFLAEATRRFPASAALANVRGTNLAWSLGPDPAGEPILVKYGVFLQTIFDFLIVALAIFMVIRAINRLKRPPPPAADPAPAPDVVLLTEIRDLLKRQ